jgi:hypothetical protein
LILIVLLLSNVIVFVALKSKGVDDVVLFYEIVGCFAGFVYWLRFLARLVSTKK